MTLASSKVYFYFCAKQNCEKLRSNVTINFMKLLFWPLPPSFLYVMVDADKVSLLMAGLLASDRPILHASQAAFHTKFMAEK